MLFSAIFPNVQMSLILAPQITLSILILGGFYLSYDNLPTFVRWLSWLSFARYSFTAMVLNEFGNRQFSHCLPKCDSVSTVDLDVDRVGISSALCRMPGEQECAIAYGDDVVRSMYMHEESWPIGKPTVGAGPGRRGHAVEVGECWKTRGPVGRREGRGEEEGPASQAVRSCPLLTLRTTSALIRDRSQDPGQGREGDDAPRDALDHLIHLVQLRPFKVTSPSSRTHW